MSDFAFGSACARCHSARPVTSLDDVRSMPHSVAIYCYMPECTQCKRFQADGKAAFEKRLGAATVLRWNCSKEHLRAMAQDAGVDQLPAYIYKAIGRGRQLHVKRPF